MKMTKYEILYGVTVSHFPNEEENVREKLRLVQSQMARFATEKKEYNYENQCALHELNQAQEWCRKILSDIEDN